MTFNVLYSTLQKARNSSGILFSSVSTTCVPEEVLKGKHEFLQGIHTSNGKQQTHTDQRPYTAFSFKERYIHTSVCKHFCSKEKENNDSDKNVDGSLRKNEQASTKHNKLKLDKSQPNLVKRRSFYKIRHQNLVWDGSNKRNRMNKYKMYTPFCEKNKDLAEKRLNNVNNIICKNSELKSDKKNQNSEVLKAEDSSAKNILTIDIFPADSNSTFISHSPHKKIVNENTFITKPTIKDCKKANITLLNQNKVPMNESVLKKENEPHKQIKNIIDKDNSISLHKKDGCIYVSDKKSNDNRAFKVTTNSLQNKNSIEIIKGENSKSIHRSKSGITEKKDNLDNRINTNTNEVKGTVWNTIYRKKKSQMVYNTINDFDHEINLQNKIQNPYKNIALNQRYKFSNSINNILRPVKSKAQIPNERYDYQLLPKNVNGPIVPSINSIRNIAQKINYPNNSIMDNTFYLKSLKIGTCINELFPNTNNYNPLINISKNKPLNKFQLTKDINSAISNKKAMVTELKCEIKSWKKYEYLKKVVLNSTSDIYRSIMNVRKMTKNTIYTPRKKKQKKCSIISIPLIPNVNIKKYKKTTLKKMKTNTLKAMSNVSSNSDPIIILNLKYKKNYQTTFNDILKKNEILFSQEKFKRNSDLLEYDLKNKEFQIEKKTGVMDNINKETFMGNSFKKPEEKDMKVFMKNAKKISLENKKPWVRYMHQMNDERESTVTEINTYPSGCLKKPEFIIELLPLEDEQYAELKKLTQLNANDSQTGKGSLTTTTKSSNSIESCKPIVSNTFKKQNEKLESNIIAEPINKFKFNEIGKECEDTKLNIAKFENEKEKPVSFSDLCKMKSHSVYENKHTVSEENHTVSMKKHLNNKTHFISCNSPLDQEHSLSYHGSEETEPKVNTNELNNISSIKKLEKVIDVASKEPLKVNNSGMFQTKSTIDNKQLNEINSDCVSVNLNKTLSNDNRRSTLKYDQFPTNNIKVEVSSNIIYEQLIQNACNSQMLPKENKTTVVEEQHPKFTVSTACTQENIPSKNNSFMQNQPEYLTTDPSKQIKPIPVKPSSQQSHLIEIFFNSSQPQLSVSKESNKFQETQIEYSIKATSSKPESKNNMEFSNLCGNQLLNSSKNSNMNEYQNLNNFRSSKQFPRDINIQHSNSDQNVSNQFSHLGNVSSAQTEVLGEETTISNSSNNKGLAKQVHLDTRKTFSQSEHKTSQENENIKDIKSFQNPHRFNQSDSSKVENMNEDITEFKLFSFFKKCYPEFSNLKNSNKKALIDNIKGFFRTSYNYFKLENTEDKVPTDNVSSNSYLSNVDNNMNHNISNSFREVNLGSKQPESFPKINKHSSESKQDFHQIVVNHNIKGNKIDVLPCCLPIRKNEDKSLNGNEEFNRRFSNLLSVSPKGDFPKTSKDLEHLFPNGEISINDLETGMNKINTFRKRTISNTDNILGKNKHHSSFLNKVNDKEIEKFSVNQVKQQRSFCYLNHKKSYMNFGSKNRFYNQKMKQKLSETNVTNIKKKLRGFHYSMNSKMPLNEIPNLVKNKGNRMVPFKWKIGLKPIMKNSIKLKKGHSCQIDSDVTIKLRVTDNSNLLKTLQSFQKLSDKSNPESYWLNCFSKSIYYEDKLSPNEFLAYIRKRKLPKKSSLKNNN